MSVVASSLRCTRASAVQGCAASAWAS